MKIRALLVESVGTEAKRLVVELAAIVDFALAASIDEARGLLAVENVDLILLDFVEMGDVTLRLCSELNADPRTVGKYDVFFLANRKDGTDEMIAKLMGAKGVLLKTSVREELTWWLEHKERSR